MLEHFAVNFDDLSIVDLVADANIREHLRSADGGLQEGNTSGAAEDLAKAKTLIFAKLQKYIPKVNLEGYDRTIGLLREQPFSALGEYLDILRESCLVAMFNLPIKEYGYVRNILPSASRAAFGGEWWVQHRRATYNESEIRRALSCLVNLCIKLEVID
ncbi:hypothetical protein SAMN05216412_102438 [Nitrosospira multiformis]|uniref:Uncharacterized protein n=1 Tax=Nitrosospira multiformis TaxID=1231 RepID=A0A1I0AZ05_9PROT|nr:hypothetical protein SAMN05216412_102438 [Nitrosospira multiformis]